MIATVVACFISACVALMLDGWLRKRRSLKPVEDINKAVDDVVANMIRRNGTARAWLIATAVIDRMARKMTPQERASLLPVRRISDSSEMVITDTRKK